MKFNLERGNLATFQELRMKIILVFDCHCWCGAIAISLVGRGLELEDLKANDFGYASERMIIYKLEN